MKECLCLGRLIEEGRRRGSAAEMKVGETRESARNERDEHECCCCENVCEWGGLIVKEVVEVETYILVVGFQTRRGRTNSLRSLMRSNNPPRSMHQTLFRRR